MSRRTLQGNRRRVRGAKIDEEHGDSPRKLLHCLLACFFDRIVHLLYVHLQFGDQRACVGVHVLIRVLLDAKCLIEPVSGIEIIIEKLREILEERFSRSSDWGEEAGNVPS